VLAEAWGQPAFASNLYAAPRGLLAPDAVAFVAFAGRDPVACAMAFVSHRVAGIGWLGTVPRARGRGLGDAPTRMAARAGFALGASAAWTGASPMGESIARRIGFVPVGTYREYEPPR